MYNFSALVLWLGGIYFTYEALLAMGSTNALFMALLIQGLLSFVQSMLLNDKYRLLPETQKKIVLMFAVSFMIVDTYLNYRGISPRLGNVHAIAPNEIQQAMDVVQFNNLVSWFLAFGTAVLPEILFTVGRSNRRVDIH